MSAADPDPVYLVLRSRNTRQSKPVSRLADTAVVRIGSCHREDSHNCAYESTRVTASDNFEWTIKIEYGRVAGETVEITGCTDTMDMAEQLRMHQVQLHIRKNGDDPSKVIWPPEDNGDMAYFLDGSRSVASTSNNPCTIGGPSFLFS
jgi:hypothetical protein